MSKRILLITLLIGLCQFQSVAWAKKQKIYTGKDKYVYEQKLLEQQEIEKYERSLLPKSGFMTAEEYQNASRDISNSEKKIPEYKLPKDIKMKYVPQPTYKLARYNDPPGSVELHIERRFYFDREENCGAITSPNKDFLVYPIIYYYAENQCSAGDLFVIPLDTSLPQVSRILRANVVKRIPVPILSTDKSIREKFTFRTMTPIDFSADGTKLAAKGKIGNVNDGIWQTDLWVYDFETKKARQLIEIREAIKFYWKNTKNLILADKRWDIMPLGFDAKNPDRIVVSAYGYTGRTPTFLGNWSIDCNGERAMLESLFNPSAEISMNGFKVVQSGVENPVKVYDDEKKQDKITKKERKEAKKAAKLIEKQKKDALKKRLKEIKKQTKQGAKLYNQDQRKSGETGID